MNEVRIIKRYANRKLYDTQHSRYVTLDQISEMIRNGDDVKIIDNKTKEDLTSVTLAQIIFEEEKKQRSFLPLQAMRNIIQNGGESFAQLVNEAQRRVTSILPRRKDEDGNEIEDGAAEVVSADAAASDAAGDAATDGEAAEDEEGGLARRSRDGLAEFREWIQQSQRTIEEWQKRVDGRIRGMVEGISPFSGLQSDVKGLASRIAELEAKLATLAAQEQAPAGSNGEPVQPIGEQPASPAGEQPGEASATPDEASVETPVETQ